MPSPCHGPATLPASLGVRGPPSLLWLLVAPGGEDELRGREQRQKGRRCVQSSTYHGSLDCTALGPW